MVNYTDEVESYGGKDGLCCVGRFFWSKIIIDVVLFYQFKDYLLAGLLKAPGLNAVYYYIIDMMKFTPGSPIMEGIYIVDLDSFKLEMAFVAKD